MPFEQISSRPTVSIPRIWPNHIRLAEIRATLSLAAPISLVALVNMAMSVTDTVMAAGIGTDALAAAAVGSDFYSVVFYFAAGVVSGLGPYYAAALASGNDEQASRLRLDGWLLAALCAALAVPAIWFAPSYLGAVGLDPDLLAEGAVYTRLMALTAVPMLVVTMFRTRLSAEERPGLLLRVTLAAVPLNAALNYVLMFGAGAWPGLGLVGAGLSSFLVAGLIAALLVILGRSRGGCPAAAPRLGDFADMLRTGVQIGVATVAEVGIFLGATLFAATLGPADVAAHAIAIRAAGVAYALPLGLLQASVVRASRAEGLESVRTLRYVIASGIAVGCTVGAILFMLIATVSVFFQDMFQASTVGQSTATTAAALLFLVAIFQLYDAPGSVAAGILRGRRDTRAPMVMTLAGYWGVSAPLGIWLANTKDMGAVGIWIGLAAGTAVSSGLLLARLRKHWVSGDPGSSDVARTGLSDECEAASVSP